MLDRVLNTPLILALGRKIRKEPINLSIHFEHEKMQIRRIPFPDLLYGVLPTWSCFMKLFNCLTAPKKAWKVSVFGVFLVRIFPHLDWIRRAEYGEILRISPYLVRIPENTDHKNSEIGHFSRSEKIAFSMKGLLIKNPTKSL